MEGSESLWVYGCDGAFNLDVEPGVHCCCVRRVGAVRSGRVAVTSAGKARWCFGCGCGSTERGPMGVRGDAYGWRKKPELRPASLGNAENAAVCGRAEERTPPISSMLTVARRALPDGRALGRWYVRWARKCSVRPELLVWVAK